MDTFRVLEVLNLKILRGKKGAIGRGYKVHKPRSRSNKGLFINMRSSSAKTD